MRLKKEEINETFDKDFSEYLIEYIEEIEALGAKFKYLDTPFKSEDEEHHIFAFEIDEKFKVDKSILNRDDDSQPHNSYRIYFGSLFVYETRFH